MLDNIQIYVFLSSFWNILRTPSVYFCIRRQRTCIFLNFFSTVYRLYWIDWQTTIDNDNEQGDIQPRVCPWLGFSFGRFKNVGTTSHTRIHTCVCTHAHKYTHSHTPQKKTMASHSHVKLCRQYTVLVPPPSAASVSRIIYENHSFSLDARVWYNIIYWYYIRCIIMTLF